jgi:hypothetical protein
VPSAGGGVGGAVPRDAGGMDESAPPDDTIDFVGITRLHGRYADVITRRAWSELSDIMTADCTLDLDLGDRRLHHVGPDAIGQFISEAVARFSFFEMVVLNTVAEIESGVGRAGARMYTVELRETAADGVRSDAFGLYHDVLLRGDGGRWRFAERRYQSIARGSAPGSARDMEVFDVGFRPLSEL